MYVTHFQQLMWSPSPRTQKQNIKRGTSLKILWCLWNNYLRKSQGQWLRTQTWNMHLLVCCISSLNILATSFAASPQNQNVYFIEKLMSKLDPSWFQKMGLHYFLSFAPDWFRCTASDCRNTKLQTAVMKPHYLTLKKKIWTSGSRVYWMRKKALSTDKIWDTRSPRTKHN